MRRRFTVEGVILLALIAALFTGLFVVALAAPSADDTLEPTITTYLVGPDGDAVEVHP